MAKRKKSPPESKDSQMRRFLLRRREDVSGVSGTGIVAEGVRLSNGQAILHWLSQFNSVTVFHSVDILAQVHSHEGATVLEWIDSDPMKGD